MSLFNGPMFVAIGAAWVAAMGAIGSGIGIGRTTSHAGGILSEKPELFGKTLVIMALPGTQGFYSLVVMFLMLQFFGFVAGTPKASLSQGIAALFVGIFIGLVEFKTALDQAHSALGSLDLTAKRPEESGRAILLPALVETYAILGLLSGVLLSLWISKAVF
ncbi:MAG: V-type ATP synthase subunit K [Caldisericum sp.]|uniref:Permease n=1 Tax=Caldisericum exile TaxID=693075 RepID=A0A2J6X4N9_9BACT|nr:MAG: permease [Caldisericum exile]